MNQVIVKMQDGTSTTISVKSITVNECLIEALKVVEAETIKLIARDAISEEIARYERLRGI